MRAVVKDRQNKNHLEFQV